MVTGNIVALIIAFLLPIVVFGQEDDHSLIEKNPSEDDSEGFLILTKNN